MFNLRNISKVLLVAGLLACAPLFSDVSSVRAQTSDDDVMNFLNGTESKEQKEAYEARKKAAAEAAAKKRQETLAAGKPVYQQRGTSVYVTYPDGREEVHKNSRISTNKKGEQEVVGDVIALMGKGSASKKDKNKVVSTKQVGDNVEVTYGDGRTVVHKNSHIGADGKGNVTPVANNAPSTFASSNSKTEDATPPLDSNPATKKTATEPDPLPEPSKPNAPIEDGAIATTYKNNEQRWKDEEEKKLQQDAANYGKSEADKVLGKYDSGNGDTGTRTVNEQAVADSLAQQQAEEDALTLAEERYAKANAPLPTGPVGGTNSLTSLYNSTIAAPAAAPKTTTAADSLTEDGKTAVTSATAAAEAQKKADAANEKLKALTVSHNEEGYEYRKQLEAAKTAMANAKTPEEIAKAKAELDKAQKLYDDYEDDYKEQKKNIEEEVKKAEKAAKDAKKTAKKDAKEAVNDAEKDVKKADKALKDAEKDFQDGKIDAAALAAAREKSEAAHAALDKLNTALQDPVGASTPVSSGSSSSLSSGIDANGKIIVPEAPKSARAAAADKETAAAKAAYDAAEKEYSEIAAQYEAAAKKCSAAVSAASGGDAKIAANNSADCKEAQKLSEQTSQAREKANQLGSTYTAAQSKSDAIYQKENADKVSGSTETYSSAKKTYNEAKGKYQDLQTKYNKAERECRADIANGGNRANSQACTDADNLKNSVDQAKLETDNAYRLMKTAGEKSKEAAQAPQKAVTDAQKEVADAQKKVDDLQKQLDKAKDACEYSKKLTSKGGQKDADKYCSQAEQLEQDLQNAKEAKTNADNKLQEAKDDLIAASADASPNEIKGMIYAGTAGQGYGTETTGNIFSIMTRRAMNILLGLKQIVYVMAGFGLIGFAYMAIFNKISWKWFSQIAIGLFLVANMGRFIEYFVFPNGQDEWEINQGKLSYGDYLSEGLGDTTYDWIEESAAYTPPGEIGDEMPDSSAQTPEEKKKARGFCGKTDGASGWANFTSCVKDITSAGRKAVDAAKTAKQTIDNTVSRVQLIGKAIGNMGDGFSGGGIKGIVNGISGIAGNANYIAAMGSNIVNDVVSNTSKIANNVQDVTKSTDQVAELDAKRAKGEGTNAIDRFLKGQTVGVDGEVERDYEGNIISDPNAVSKVVNTVNDITQKSKELNNEVQKGTKSAVEGIDLFEDVTGIKAKRNEKNNQKAREQNSASNAAQAKVDAEKNAAAQKAKQEASEAAKKAQQESEAQDFINKYKNSQNPDTTTTAKNAVNDAKTAAAAAKQAEQVAQSKDKTASSAEKQANEKKALAETAAANAQKAAAKAAATGSEADKRAAETAAKRAEIAKTDAETAVTKAKYAREEAAAAAKAAEEAQKPVKELADKAREAAISEAQRVQKEAVAESAAADKAIAAARENITKKEDAAKTAQQAADKALKEALDKNDTQSILAAKKAQETADKAAREVTEAKSALTKEQERKKEADIRAAEAKTFAQKVTAEKDLGLDTTAIKEYDTQLKDAAKLLDQSNRSSTAIDKAKEAVAAAKAASAAAQKAENDANSRQSNANNAEKEAQEKAAATALAEKNAKAAAEKAAATGKEEDKKEAKLAEQRAAILKTEAEIAAKKSAAAAAEAEAAKKAAEKAKEPLADLTKKAQQAAIDAAKDVQDNTKSDLKTAEAAINAAKEDEKAKKEALAQAQKAAEAAAKDAGTYGDAASVAAAKKAADAAKKAAQEYAAAQEKTKKEQAAKKAVSDRDDKAKVFEQKTTAEKNYGLSDDVMQNMAEREKAAAAFEDQYAQNNTPDKVAERAQDKAQQAERAAQSAQSAADAKARAAEKAAEYAKALAAKAATGDAAAKREAERAKQRADLAARDAAEAKTKAKEAQAPVAKLKAEADAAMSAGAAYSQKAAAEEVKAAEKKIAAAKTAAQKAAQEAQKAENEAAAKLQAALQYKDAASVAAAQEAARKAAEVKEKSMQAQREIDAAMKERAAAENKYMQSTEAVDKYRGVTKAAAKTTANDNTPAAVRSGFAATRSTVNSAVTGEEDAETALKKQNENLAAANAQTKTIMQERAARFAARQQALQKAAEEKAAAKARAAEKEKALAASAEQKAAVEEELRNADAQKLKSLQDARAKAAATLKNRQTLDKAM